MKLLVIDDDPAVCEALQLNFLFHQPSWQIESAGDGFTGLRRFFDWQPDVVVLDVGLGSTDGSTILERMRAASPVRIIMLSAQAGEEKVAKLLELGADDYVTKPFRTMELVARIRVQARRARALWGARTGSTRFTARGLEIDFPSREVRVNGSAVALTNTEYRLLYHLVQNAGKLMNYESLLQLVWRSDVYTTDAVRVYMSRLRRKIEADSQTRHIVTKAGLGYVFLAPDAPDEPIVALLPNAE